MRQDVNNKTNVIVTVTPYPGRPWFVAGSYRIEERNRGRQVVRVLVADYSAPRGGRAYIPADEPHLVEHLAAVTDEKSLLQFAHRYGLLVGGQQEAVLLAEARIGRFGNRVTWALAHARAVRAILDGLQIIHDVRSGRADLDTHSPEIGHALKAIFKRAGIVLKKATTVTLIPRSGSLGGALTADLPDGVSEEEIHLLDTRKGHVPRVVFSSHWETDPIRAAYDSIRQLINPMIRGLRYELASGNQGQLGLRLEWNELIEVIYWHLLTRIGGEFRQCKRPDCGRLFPVSDPRDKYCSPRCGNTLRQRKYRAKQKQSRRARLRRQQLSRKKKPRRRTKL